MPLQSLHLKNFRGFLDRQIDLHPRLTVIASTVNGDGKTSILEAALTALHPMLKGLHPKAKAGILTLRDNPAKADPTAKSDQTNPQPRPTTEVTAVASLDGVAAPLSWTQSLKVTEIYEQTNSYYYGQKEMRLETSIESDSGVDSIKDHAAMVAVSNVLPILRYISVQRVMFDANLPKQTAKKLSESPAPDRLDSYLLADDGHYSPTGFLTWFKWLHSKENNALGLTQTERERLCKIVQQCIDAVITQEHGWHTLTYTETDPCYLLMHHPERGVLPVSMLGRSIMLMTMLAADLAYRACSLNPSMDDPTQCPGVVLIDMIEHNLDTHWQKTIVSTLVSLFPKVQFIITTASPFVALSVDSEHLRALPPIHGTAATNPP